MKRYSAMMLLCLAVGVAARAQESEDGSSREATKLLKKSAAALKKVHRVTYEADYKGTAWIKALVPEVTGTVTIGSRSKYDIDPFLTEVKITKSTEEGAEDPVSLTAGCDGDIYFLIDEAAKTVYADMDPLVLGRHSRDIRRVVVSNFADPKPYGDIDEATSVKILDTASVAGVPCHVVSVEAEQPPVVTYYLGTRDYLPRRIVRTYENPEGDEGTTDLTLRDVSPNPSFARNPFDPVVPSGYTKTDEFAP